VLLVFFDLEWARLDALSAYYGAEGVHKFLAIDSHLFAEPSAGQRFLRHTALAEPSRSLSYVPSRNEWSQTQRFAEPALLAVGANNRSIVAGLQDVQGYNPVHLRRYDEYLAALNDRSQNYHNAEVFAHGLDSPLLDLLNVRYVVTPVSETEQVARVRQFPPYAEVYRDNQVAIFENPHALPRAWIVHDARRVDRAEVLPLLASGTIDPRKTVLIEEEAPAVSQNVDPGTSAASVIAYEPERIVVRVTGQAPGLLVLSEVYHPAWRAAIGGQETHVLVANHALRAVPVPAGNHTVELRYESGALHLGLAVSLAFLAAIIVLLMAPSWTKQRERRRLQAPSDAAVATGGWRT
jgi:hypothetical protein